MKKNAVVTIIPVRLRIEPLIEAVWEIRVTSEKQNVADLLPGLIYQALPGRYPRIVRLPVADIPAPIAEKDQNLRYIPKIRLEGDSQVSNLSLRLCRGRNISCGRSAWRRAVGR